MTEHQTKIAEPAVWKVRPENLPEHSQFREKPADQGGEPPAPAGDVADDSDNTESGVVGGWCWQGLYD